MRISTRGKNTINLMLDLATYHQGEPVRLKDIAKRQDISDKSCQVLTWIISDFFQGTH